MSEVPEATGEGHPGTRVGATADGTGGLPVDPDLVSDEDSGAPGPFGSRRPSWPRLRLDVIAAVFAGGCVGGVSRYAVTSAWQVPPGHFPWPTFAVNVAGALVLAIVIVVAADLVPSRYLRPLLGTGFCGALTTFSSVVVAAAQLLAHHHAGTAGAYLAATVSGALAAASLGLLLGRSVVANRRRARDERSAR